MTESYGAHATCVQSFQLLHAAQFGGHAEHVLFRFTKNPVAHWKQPVTLHWLQALVQFTHEVLTR